MSMNDPRWGGQNGDNNGSGGGKRPDQGPPDLEEIWRDFNRRLGGLFGKKGGGNRGNGGGGGSTPDLDPKTVSSWLIILAGLGVVLWMASGFYIVDAPERGVVLQFGKHVETTEPGLRWRLPYPIQSHELVNVGQVRTLEVGYRSNKTGPVLNEALMLTDDENIVNIQFAVQYIVNDPEKYLFEHSQPDNAVMMAAETAMREVVGKSKMDFVLYEGRDVIAAQATVLMQAILDRYKTGIVISKVNMQNAQPPEQVQAAFDDAVKAGQDRERQKNEGQAYANDVIPRAKGAAARLMQEANGYRQRIIATAEGDASRFSQILVEYSKAPEVTRKRMYLETLQQVYTNTAKVMVDAKGQGNLLYLPLDKLMQATVGVVAPQQGIPDAAVRGQQQSVGGSSAVVPQVEQPPAVDGKSSLSGSLSSRDRVSRDREIR